VFDVNGTHVATLYAGALAAGPNQTRWDGRDVRGATVASGIYFVRVKVGKRYAAARLVLLR